MVFYHPVFLCKSIEQVSLYHEGLTLVNFFLSPLLLQLNPFLNKKKINLGHKLKRDASDLYIEAQYVCLISKMQNIGGPKNLQTVDFD